MTSQHIKPLEGLLVIALEQAVAAPLCTMRLADAGARVIKIERAGGETARHYDTTVNGVSSYFAWLNRGKESAVLDLKSADDLALMKRMLARADVFVQNLAPGATRRLGLGPEALQAENPRLITVDMMGYGQDTDYADMRAYDLLVQAESGVCAVTGPPDMPCKVGVPVADVGNGMNAHAAILEALIERSITGKGRAIEVTMFDTLADWMNVPILQYEHTGRETQRYGLGHATVYPYRPYACLDGEVIIVVQNPDEWARLCDEVLKRSDLKDDPRFHDNPARLDNRDALDCEIEAVFGELSQAEAIRRLEAARLAWAKVATVPDVSDHPALRRQTVSVAGERVDVAASPLRRLDDAPAVPALGEHTEAVRKEFA